MIVLVGEETQDGKRLNEYFGIWWTKTGFVANESSWNPRSLIVRGQRSGTLTDADDLRHKYAHLRVSDFWFRADPAILGEFI